MRFRAGKTANDGKTRDQVKFELRKIKDIRISNRADIRKKSSRKMNKSTSDDHITTTDH